MSKKRKQLPTPKQREFLTITGIFAAALIFRIWYLYESSANPTFEMPVVDSESYHFRALHLAGGGGLTDDFFWQPLFYQLFLSLTYFLGGSSILFAKVIQILLGAVTCVLTYRLGQKAFGRRVGIAAGLITALYGPLIFFEAELLAAGWAAFWSVVLILLFLNTGESKSLRLCFVLGLCGAMSIITRPTYLPFFFAGCVWLGTLFYRTSTGFRPPIRGLAAVLAGFLVITLPVAGLNHRVTGHFGFLPASGGINFYIGNNPNIEESLTIRTGKDWIDLTRLPVSHGVTDMWEGQKFFYNKVWNFARSEPLGFTKGILQKVSRFINSREIPRNIDIYLFREWSPLLSILTWKVWRVGFPFVLLMPFAVAGLFYFRRQVPVPLVLFAFLYPLSIILVFVSARYRVPVVPALAILASSGGAAVFGEFRSKKRSRKLLFAGCGLCVILLTVLPGPFPEEEINYEAELYYGVGCTQERSGRSEEAITNFYKAVTIKPDFADAHVNIGNFFSNRGKTAEAMKHFQEALKASPNHAGAHYNSGVAMLRIDNIPEAIKYFQEAVRIRPDFGIAHHNLAMALVRTGKSAEALTHLREAVKFMPTSEEAHSSLGSVLAMQGDFSGAISEFREALELKPNSTEALNKLARILATCEDKYYRKPEESIQLAERACELTSFREASFLETLALAYASGGRMSEAQKTAQKAFETAVSSGQNDLAVQIESRFHLNVDKLHRQEPQK